MSLLFEAPLDVKIKSGPHAGTEPYLLRVQKKSNQVKKIGQARWG